MKPWNLAPKLGLALASLPLRDGVINKDSMGGAGQLPPEEPRGTQIRTNKVFIGLRQGPVPVATTGERLWTKQA